MPEIMLGEDRIGILPYDQPGGGIGGAIIHGENYTTSKDGIKAYLNGGDDLNTILSRVEKAGGKITSQKTVITPEFGYFAAFVDTEGNQVYLHSMS
jgi:predicted enzyme related to lactoylglutathione lyase